MTFYRYLAEHDVHVFDCSGQLTLELGISRLGVLRRQLEARPAKDGVTKLLIDFRRTTFDSPLVHRELSLITRRDFGLNSDNHSTRFAILDPNRAGQVAHNEAWFQDELEALQWLGTCSIHALETDARQGDG